MDLLRNYLQTQEKPKNLSSSYASPNRPWRRGLGRDNTPKKDSARSSKQLLNLFEQICYQLNIQNYLDPQVLELLLELKSHIDMYQENCVYFCFIFLSVVNIGEYEYFQKFIAQICQNLSKEQVFNQFKYAFNYLLKQNVSENQSLVHSVNNVFLIIIQEYLDQFIQLEELEYFAEVIIWTLKDDQVKHIGNEILINMYQQFDNNIVVNVIENNVSNNLELLNTFIDWQTSYIQNQDPFQFEQDGEGTFRDINADQTVISENCISKRQNDDQTVISENFVSKMDYQCSYRISETPQQNINFDSNKYINSEHINPLETNQKNLESNTKNLESHFTTVQSEASQYQIQTLNSHRINKSPQIANQQIQQITEVNESHTEQKLEVVKTPYNLCNIQNPQTAKCIKQLQEILLTSESLQDELGLQLIISYEQALSVQEKINFVLDLKSILINQTLLTNISEQNYYILLNLTFKLCTSINTSKEIFQNQKSELQSDLTKELQILLDCFLCSKSLTMVLVNVLKVLNQAVPIDFSQQFSRQQKMLYKLILKCLEQLIESYNQTESVNSFEILLVLYKFFKVHQPEKLVEGLPSLKDFEMIFRNLKQLADQVIEINHDSSVEFVEFIENDKSVFLQYLRNKLL